MTGLSAPSDSDELPVDHTLRLHHPSAGCSEWWSRLSEPVREWLIEHPGADLPRYVTGALLHAGAPVIPDANWPIPEDDDSTFVISDEAVSWLRSLAETGSTGQ